MPSQKRTQNWFQRAWNMIPAVRRKRAIAPAIARGKRAVELRVRLNIPKVREELLREFYRLYQSEHVSENKNINQAIQLSAKIATERRNKKDTKKEEKEFDQLMEAIGRETTDSKLLQISRENASVEQNYPDIMAKRIAMREIGISRSDKAIVEFLGKLPVRTLRKYRKAIFEKLGKKTDQFIRTYEEAYRELTK